MKTSLMLGLSVALVWNVAAQEIGYVETFSLAGDREAALKELVPGTDEYFYYQALQAQNASQRERFQEVMDRWIRERNGRTLEGARELLNRQALLDYEKNPKKTLGYLTDQLALHFTHARKTGERRSDAPTRFDNAQIGIPILLKRALAEDPGSLAEIEDAGLDLAAGQPVNGDQGRNLLARLQRPDYPGLVDLILADLKYRDSRGFGSLDIHKRLTLAQMDELLQKEPALRNQAAFVNAYLPKLAPENEVELDTDAPAREAYLQRVWAFVNTLDPSNNSLKAHVLYHRLRHDQKLGVYDPDRFLEYVKLPRNVYYLRDDIRQQLPRGDYMARLDQQFGLIQLGPIANDEPLVRAFLLHFLVAAPNADAYKPWIRDDFLQRVFAEAKIVNGVGDPSQWSALLAPDEYKRLKERVDIDFAPANPDVIGLETPVKLSAFVKNVPALIVKVYEINTFNYYRETGQPLNLAINLDGLVASSERRVEYKETSERRVARTFEFPELKTRGAYVVELIGNGKSSRALVQKGRLGVLQEVTSAGHSFTVLDETGRRLPDAHAWLGGREFIPGADGRILVPFSTAPQANNLIVRQGGFASLVRFNHLAETYDLHAGLYVDRESLIRREKAKVVLRPVLRVNGRPVSLKLLEEPRLTIRSVDLQGIAAEKDIPGIELREDAETVRDILVPDNAVSLSVTLKARIQNISRNQKQDLSSSVTFTLNGIDRSAAVQDLHVSRTAAGYLVELRGKNGEPLPGEPLTCFFKHRLFRDEVQASLKTDEQGRASLGALAGIERFRVQEPGGAEHTWLAARGDCTYPASLQGRVGETLSVPLVFDSAEPLKEVSLIESRHGQFVKDWRAALAVNGAFIELKGLPAGDYSLYLKPAAREIAVRVTQGADQDGFTSSPRRSLERARLAPLQVAAVDVGADTVDIRLANASPFSRVHVLATRYLPAYDVFEKLGFAGTPDLAQQPWRATRTFYESGRDIGDEYRYIIDRQTAKKFPGNMLDRPGLLLNPWAVRDTATQAESLEEGRAYGGRAASLSSAGGAGVATAYGAGEPPEGYASLDFLKQPSVVLLNLVPDKEGRVRIPRADLKGKPQLRILAVDPVTTVLKQVCLDDTPVETRELRLAGGLDPAKAFSEQKLIALVQPKGSLTINDATTARFETYDTVAKAYRLLATLGANPTFEEFAFIANWPDLPPVEKQRQYSKYACHELSFFLYHKDPDFFKTVIAPYLRSKKDKTFLDHWLIGDDVKDYLEPWRFARLNIVERILLGKRLREQGPSVIRDVRDRADLIPPDIEDFNRRFDTAVQTGAMETEGELRNSLGGLRDLQDEKQALALRGLHATAAAAPSAPETAAAMMVTEAPSDRAMNREESAKDGDALGIRAGRLARKSVTALDKAGKADEPMPGPGAEAKEQFFFKAGGDKRQEALRRFFQKLDQTKEWAENNYYHLPIEQQLAELVSVNDFWADYAAHDGKTPFLSKSFPQATRHFTEMMLALAVLDLPFKAGAHEEKLDGLRYAVQAASPLILFHREIREATRATESGAVLVTQHFFRADDRYRHENNEQFDKYVNEEFLPHVVYGAQVVLTNPSGNRQKLQVLRQIPMGAIPVNGGFYTRGSYVVLEPYSTQTLEYYFYFPQTGRFPHYPVTLASDDKVVAAAPAFVFNVVGTLTRIDKTSWAWISQNGTPEEVLAFLDQANLHRLDLNEIAWRMRDREFFKKATALLEARHVYQDTLWSYSMLHNDPQTLRAFLRHSPFADRCGLCLASPLLTLDPVERLDYQFLEYAPLVNARAHSVGAKRKILNDRFREQYQRFMKVLTYKPALDNADKLAVAFYLALQNRVEEALDWFGRVDRKALAEQLQYDYFQAYLAFYRGDVEGARTLAKQHANEGVDRWRNRFALVLSQLDELGGGKTDAADKEDRDQAQGALAATEPSLDMQVEAGKIRLDYRNLKVCTLNFYPMDIELLFSRSPFLQDGVAQFSYIRPMLSQSVDLPAGKDTLSVDLPKAFGAKNVMVEALAAGVRKTQAYYANTLKVQMIEAYGQLVVTHAETHKPVPGAYVKVYARLPGGAVKFFKDGYTDLRGRFDYVSLNTNELEAVERLAVLILSEDFGALVRESPPPRR